MKRPPKVGETVRFVGLLTDDATGTVTANERESFTGEYVFVEWDNGETGWYTKSELQPVPLEAEPSPGARSNFL